MFSKLGSLDLWNGQEVKAAQACVSNKILSLNVRGVKLLAYFYWRLRKDVNVPEFVRLDKLANKKHFRPQIAQIKIGDGNRLPPLVGGWTPDVLLKIRVECYGHRGGEKGR